MIRVVLLVLSIYFTGASLILLIKILRIGKYRIDKDMFSDEIINTNILSSHHSKYTFYLQNVVYMIQFPDMTFGQRYSVSRSNDASASPHKDWSISKAKQFFI